MFYLHIFVMGKEKRIGKISIDKGPIIKVDEGEYFHLVPGKKHILNIYRKNKNGRLYVAWNVELDGRDNYKCGVDIPPCDNDPKHDLEARFSYELDCRYRKKEMVDWETSAYGNSKNPNFEKALAEDHIEFSKRARANDQTISRWVNIKKTGKFIPFRKPRLKFLKPLGFILLIPAILFMPEQFFPVGPAFLVGAIAAFVLHFLLNFNILDRLEYYKEKQKMLDEMSTFA